jgi:hypothetical protein
MSNVCIVALSTGLLSLGAIAENVSAIAPNEQAKWFVLRNHEIGNCWTAVLVRINSQYTNAFEQRAGGPYDTEAQAIERQKSLENQGVCRPN